MKDQLFQYIIKLLPLAEMTRQYINAVYMEKIEIERKAYEAERLSTTKLSALRKLEKIKNKAIGGYESELRQYDRLFKRLVDQHKDTQESNDLIEFTVDYMNLFFNKAVMVDGYNVKIDTDEPVYIKSREAFMEKYNLSAHDLDKMIENGEVRTCLMDNELKIVE